jgi:hypothetical protein
MNVEDTIQLAGKHASDNADGSDRFCLLQATKLQDEGRVELARTWALRSLAHSIGIFHPDYKQAFHAAMSALS